MPSLCFVSDLSIKVTGTERILTKVPSPQRRLQMCYSSEPLTTMTSLDSLLADAFSASSLQPLRRL